MIHYHGGGRLRLGRVSRAAFYDGEFLGLDLESDLASVAAMDDVRAFGFLESCLGI